jgi:hypothetical protein
MVRRERGRGKTLEYSRAVVGMRGFGLVIVLCGGVLALSGGRASSGTAAGHAANPDPGCAGVLLRADNGAPVPGADAVRGDRVRAVVPDGRGGWYVGGRFWRVGRLARTNLAHLDRTGQVDPAWNPRLDGSVTALALSGGTLYLAGAFHTVGGARRAGVAAVDAATGRPTAWQPPPPPPGAQVDTLAAERDRVYLGWTTGIVVVDAKTGRALPPAIPGGSPFAVQGERAYVTGGSYYTSLRALSTTSGTPVPWNVDARGYMSQVLTDRVRVIPGGRFRTGGRRGVKVAAWETGSEGRTLWLARVNGFFVNAVAVAGGRVYLGGLFVAVDGKPRPRLAAVDVARGLATTWKPRWNADRRWTPLTIAATATRVFVGAAVTSQGNVPPCARRP